jgi:hypothetical protein
MPARTMSTSSFPEFVAFYRTHRDRVEFKEKLVFDRLIDDGEPENFEFKVTEYDDLTQLRVRYGPRGMSANTYSIKLDPQRTYLIYHEQDAFDRLEELINSGELIELDRRLGQCVNALLGLADDPIKAKLYLTIATLDGRIAAMYADAFNEMITVEYP